MDLRARASLGWDSRSAGHTLIIANHTSWLDILILAGATNCAFVSQGPLGHGLLHWLADQNATVYVKRSHVKGAKDQAIALAAALEVRKPVTSFPKRRPAQARTCCLPLVLLEAEITRQGRRNPPVAVDYRCCGAEVGWWQEPGKANVLRIARRRGTLPVTPAPAGAARPRRRPQELARQAREAIASTLGFKSEPPSPIGLDE
jgi:1-acyl-sn-glycerol-3-phosphate acyltransferase